MCAVVDVCPSVEASAASRFLATEREDGDHNQYWYSQPTIDALCQEVEASASGGPVAFIATPSLFFSLPQGPGSQGSDRWLLDIDTRWDSDPGYVRYDFNEPSNVPEHLHGSCSMVVIDPPFITAEAWRKFATTVHLLLKPGGRVMCSTVAENEPLMQELFGASSCAFKPSCPNLIYQFSLFTNFPPATQRLLERNPEVPEDD